MYAGKFYGMVSRRMAKLIAPVPAARASTDRQALRTCSFLGIWETEGKCWWSPRRLRYVLGDYLL